MAKIWTKIIEALGGQIIKEGLDTTEKIVIARTKFIRFVKLCLSAIALLFLGIALLMSIKNGDKETANTILEYFMNYGK